MSKAFTSEDSPSVEATPAMPAGRRPVTEAGLARQRVQLAELTEQLQALGAAPDEAGLEGRRQRRQQLDLQVARLARRIALSDPIPEASGDRVSFGSLVRVCPDGGQAVTYRLVGPDEVDAAAGLISHQAPLARALLGARAGDEVTVLRPRGELSVQVLAVGEAAAAGQDAQKLATRGG